MVPYHQNLPWKVGYGMVWYHSAKYIQKTRIFDAYKTLWLIWDWYHRAVVVISMVWYASYYYYTIFFIVW